MEQAAPEEVIKVFTRLAVNADLDAEDVADLRRLAKELSGGVNLKAIDSALKAAQEKHAEQQARARREHSDATRCDPRPLIPAPLHDAPWQPEMDTLNEVLGGVRETKPPSRDIDGVTTCGRKHPVPELHAFTEANAEEE
jgi:predicted xylose isomerase-like sugar epimerase